MYRAINPDGQVALYQFMELAGLGSADKLRTPLSRLDGTFKEQLLFCLADGLLQGLSEMHQAGFCHLDIKPNNLAVQHDGAVRLIDFGCSAKMKGQTLDIREENGDMAYFSPERMLGSSATSPGRYNGTKIDAWAAGLTLLVLTNPKTTEDLEEIFIEMQDLLIHSDAEHRLHHYVHTQLAKIPALKNPIPDSCEALILILLTLHPDKRLSPVKALQHPWFKKMKLTAETTLKEVVGYLREFVQTQQRTKRSQKKAAEKTFEALSPQDLPLPHFTSFVERPTLQNQLEKILFSSSVSSYTSKAPLLVCQGMGGVGKSQLLTYIMHNRKVQDRFGLRLWFRYADKRDLLATQCVTLAKELALIEDKTDAEEALRKLHQYLAIYPKRYGKPWLAVFDNADDFERLAPYLPPSGGHCVVTTRSTTWKDALSIDVLTPQEGEALVKKLLLKADPHSLDLCKELGFLALGIVQACAFIRNQQITIPAYLEQLRKAGSVIEKDELLFGKELPSSVLGLWQTTFETIKGLSKEAYQLLEALSFLAPDNLTPKLLLAFASPAAQDILKSYALLQVNNKGVCTIHRLVQLALRNRLEKETQIAILAKGMKALYKEYNPELNLQAELANRQLLDHGEALLEHYKRLSSPAQLQELWLDTLIWIDKIQADRTPALQRKMQFEAMLLTAQQLYGQEHTIIADILNRLGEAWYHLGDAKSNFSN